MTNLEGIQRILELKEENSEAEIIFMTAEEVVADTGCAYWKCEIGSVELELLWWNEDFDIYEIGHDDIMDGILNTMEGSDDESKVVERYEELIATNKIRECILVKLEP